MNITYEGKIKLKETIGARTFLALVHFLTEEKGFTVKKYKTDEVKLVKVVVTEQGETQAARKQVRENVEVEIEVSDDKFEIEVESGDLETVKNLTSELAGKL